MFSKQTTLSRLFAAGLAVSFLLLATACGKKGGDNPPPPPPAKPQSTPAPSPSPSPAPLKKRNGEDPGPSTPSQTKVPPIPKPNDGKGKPTKPNESGEDTPPTDTPEETGDDTKKKDDKVATDSEGPTKFEAESMDEIGKHPRETFGRPVTPATGVSSEWASADGVPMVYTGSGIDELQAQSKKLLKAAAKNAAGKKANYEFASRIYGATDYSILADGSLSIKIKMPVGKKGAMGYVNFGGKLDNKRTLKSGSLKSGSKVAIEARCMDADESCETLHIRLKDGNKPFVRTAHIIARNTKASIFIQGNDPGMARNANYDRFVSVMLNTVHAPGSFNSISSLRMKTWEVIDGMAGFSIDMTVLSSSQRHRRGNVELVQWVGPLARPVSSNRLSPRGIQIVKRDTGGPIGAVIRQTKLIRNDGRGNLQMDVTVHKSSARSHEDTIRLTISRMHKATNSL